MFILITLVPMLAGVCSKTQVSGIHFVYVVGFRLNPCWSMPLFFFIFQTLLFQFSLSMEKHWEQTLSSLSNLINKWALFVLLH